MLHLLITGNVGPAGASVLIDVVLCLEQALGLFSVGVELNPLLVGRLADAMSSDAGGLQPAANCVDSSLSGGKDLDDLLGCVVLAKAGRVVARAGSRASQSSGCLITRRGRHTRP